MRCEFNQNRLARHTEQLDADVNEPFKVVAIALANKIARGRRTGSRARTRLALR
jgi:hypothetical protein